jgi:integrase
MREPRLVRYRGKFAVLYYEEGIARRQSLGTESKAEADRRFRTWRSESSRLGDTVSEIMTAYLEDRKHHATGYQTLAYNWKALRSHFEGFGADDITRDACRAYIGARRKLGISDGTIRREMGTLRAAIRWGRPTNLSTFVFPPAPQPRERHLSREEYRALVIAAAKEPHITLFAMLALSTAGRAQAILDLTWDRVDFERGIIRLSGESGARKGRATVPMTPEARNALLEAKEAALSEHVIEWAGAWSPTTPPGSPTFSPTGATPVWSARGVDMRGSWIGQLWLYDSANSNG